jgi:hypothetical protein
MVARLRFWHGGASPTVIMSGGGVMLHEGRRVVRQPQKWGEKELIERGLRRWRLQSW